MSVSDRLKYHTLRDMLKRIDVVPRAGCLRLFDTEYLRLKEAHGSVHNHQAWPGGWHDHVEEVMNIGIVLYEQMNRIRALPFTLSDLLLVLFLHDIEKPWKYEVVDGVRQHTQEFASKADDHAFKMKKVAEFHIILTDEHINGIKYAEGELGDYSNRKRVMSPLAAMAHMADVMSARVWFDYPKMPDAWRT